MMSLEQAKEIWRNAKHPLTKPGDKHVDGLLTYSGGINHPLPVFSPGKGGRVWGELYLTMELLEALVVIGRDQIPEPPEGYRILAYDDAGEETTTDHPVMTPEVAQESLAEKRNGYFCPSPPRADATEFLMMGEAQLDELQAYLVLWKQVADPTNEHSA